MKKVGAEIMDTKKTYNDHHQDFNVVKQRSNALKLLKRWKEFSGYEK